MKPQQPDGCEDFTETSNAADRFFFAPSFQPSRLQQPLRIRSCAPEAFVKDHRLFGAAGLKDVVLEGGGGGGVEDASLTEKLKGVLVENLGPEVADRKSVV